MLLEVCCENIESLIIASQYGADRIELCASLETGGLTPSIDFIKMSIEHSMVPLMILVRPRAGNFHYSAEEKKQILREIESICKLDIEGIVTGAVTEKSHIDIALMKDIISVTEKHSLTFHRAFDFISEPFEALEELIELGIDRILTSGQQSSAENGIELISELRKRANSRISIMPGAGINSSNILHIIENCRPTEIHLSAKKTIGSDHKHLIFNLDYFLTDEIELQKIKSLLSE